MPLHPDIESWLIRARQNYVNANPGQDGVREALARLARLRSGGGSPQKCALPPAILAVRIAAVSVALLIAACGNETTPDVQAAQEFDRLCSEEGMLDETNRAEWIELTEAIDRGEIRREQVSLAPQTPSFASGDRNSLEASVEARVGDVMPVATSKFDDDSALFRGPLVVLLDGERLFEFRNLYLATNNKNFLPLYGSDINIRSCFSERGGAYWSYIGRQK